MFLQKEKLKTFRILYIKCLSRSRKAQLIGSLLLLISSSLAEAASISMIIPLIAIATGDINKKYLFLISQLGKSSQDQLVNAAILLSIIVIISACVRLSYLWVSGKLAASIGSELSARIYQNSLTENYNSFKAENSNKILSTLTVRINKSILALNAFMQLISSFFVITAIIATLLYVNFALCAVLFIILSSSYVSIMLKYKSELLQNGKKIAKNIDQIFVNASDSFLIKKDLMLRNNFEPYFGRHLKYEASTRRLQARNIFIASFPKYFVEAILFITVSVLVVFLSNSGLDSLFPILAAFGLGAQKLIPLFQQSFSAVSRIQSFYPDLEKVVSLATKLEKVPPNTEKHIFSDKLSIQCTSWTHHSAARVFLECNNVSILKGEKVIILGKTGSGKTSLLNSLIGLQPPSSGRILVDNRDIYEGHNMPYSWQACVKHVPQEINMIEGSILENITFDPDPNSTDLARLNKACLSAEILDFIELLPDKFATYVGPQGSKLSGGQKQQIAIARALYSSTEVLVMDEATSAIDYSTEDKILKNICQNCSDLTVLCVTHNSKLQMYFEKCIAVKDAKISIAKLH